MHESIIHCYLLAHALQRERAEASNVPHLDFQKMTSAALHHALAGEAQNSEELKACFRSAQTGCVNQDYSKITCRGSCEGGLVTLKQVPLESLVCRLHTSGDCAPGKLRLKALADTLTSSSVALRSCPANLPPLPSLSATMQIVESGHG